MLISSALSSAFAEVVFPDQEGEVFARAFMPSALDELKSEGKYVLFDGEGVPYGFIDDGKFAETIQYGGLELKVPENGEGSVIGGGNMGNAAKDLANMRLDQGTDVDWDLLRSQDFAKYIYYSQRYGSLGDYLQDGLGLDTKQEAVDFMNGLEPSAAGEFLDVFRALEGGNPGYSHYKELLDTLDSTYGNLEDQLDPETLKKLGDFIDEAHKEIAKDMIDDALENIGPEELELLYNVLKELDYGTLYGVARDYVRELARDGTLNDIGDALSKSDVPESVMKNFTESAGEFMKERFWDVLPKNSAYYVLAAAAIIVIWSLRRVGG